MRAFIQCTVSSNMLEPINPNVFNAYKGLEDMGFECVKFSTLQDLADYYHSRGELIVGGIGIIRKRLKAFDIDPITVDYRKNLKNFLEGQYKRVLLVILLIIQKLGLFSLNLRNKKG